MAPEDTDPHKSLFEDEPEVLEGPTLDEKLDKIIDLLEKNDKEHKDIKERLEKIELNQDGLLQAYKRHGVMLGELMTQVNGHFGMGK